MKESEKELSQFMGLKVTKVETFEYRGSLDYIDLYFENGKILSITGCYDRNRNDDYVCFRVLEEGDEER